MIFATQRLYVRPLETSDEHAFFDLMSNPSVMSAIPEQPLNQIESLAVLEELIQLEKNSDTKIWCLCEKDQRELIGFCGLLKNNENQDEIAYRLREKYWNKGYGTEITKGLIHYCFSVMKSDLITADVFVENDRSIKILEKFFRSQKEFFNSQDNCIDRRYFLKRTDW